MTFSRKLTAQCFDGISTEPPPEDSLFWKMWKNSKDIAERSLNTDYIQGIKKGTLSPNSYGYSMVNDAYYCFERPDNYQKAAQRTDDFALKKYLLALEKSYRDYNEDFVTNWHLKNASSIKPIQVTCDYANFESNVAANDHPIYCLIVNLPCNYLWPWLANQIASGSPTGNVYQFWINDNKDVSVAYQMGQFLNDWMKKNPTVVNEEKAMQIYKQAMNYEYEGFRYF